MCIHINSMGDKLITIIMKDRGNPLEKYKHNERLNDYGIWEITKNYKRSS